ncbi:hypothetical protein GCM10009096_16770 [Parasphingorhabdus litoris]|uniref:Serine acetyltransferase n=1 Tax=Parasphingorhabdus litoris TaxID=394733 RepID=A0ABN1AG80_9SPHN|nr:serine acetyltransferase [Parasphingorhabdus litoris]
MALKNRDNDWRSDLARVDGARPMLKEQSLWAIKVYRYGRSVDERKNGFRKWYGTKLYWMLFRFVETLFGISIPKEASVGPGLRIWHFGGIFINPGVILGSGCTLRQGVTIGNRVEGGGVPHIGDNVEIGAYAQILGDIRIGNNCNIGASAVVLCDVPDGKTAVGNPAKII